MLLKNWIQWNHYLAKVLVLTCMIALYTFYATSTVSAATNDIQEVNDIQETKGIQETSNKQDTDNKQETNSQKETNYIQGTDQVQLTSEIKDTYETSASKMIQEVTNQIEANIAFLQAIQIDEEDAIVNQDNIIDAASGEKESNLVKEVMATAADNTRSTVDTPVLLNVKAATANTSCSKSSNVKASAQTIIKASAKTTAIKTTVKKSTTKTPAKATAKASYSKSDLRLLSSLVYAEAGNQSYKGMLAVANVVLNRMDSKAYGHTRTVKGVIYDRKWAVQFSVTIKSRKTGQSPLASALKAYDTGKFGRKNVRAEREAMTKATKAAKSALEGNNNIGKYLCFSNKYSSRGVKKRYSNYRTIGDHIFYRTI